MSRTPHDAFTLAESEVLRLFVESQTDYAIFLLDSEGRVATWNPGARRLKGYEADEIVGLHFGTFYPPEDVERGRPEDVLRRAREDGRYSEEGWRVRKDGSRFWADIVITAVRGPDGALLGYGKVTRDLTARRAAEEALRQTVSDLESANAMLELFHLLVVSVHDYAIFALDSTGHIRTWNAGAQRIKGYSATEAIGHHFSLFYTEEARARRHPDYELAVATREGRFEEEGWRVRKDGSLFWANVVITALRDATDELVGFAKVTRDLTERRRAQQRLEDSERNARREAARERLRSAALERVGRAIVGRVDLDQIVQTATDSATELTAAEFGAFVSRVDGPAGGSYVLSAVAGVLQAPLWGLPAEVKSAAFAPVFGGAVGRSADIARDHRLGPSSPFADMAASDIPVRSYLAMPVVTSDGDVAGALLFGHGEPDVFDVEAEEAAASVAASAALAITNARLLEDARRESAARARALRERDAVAQALQRSLLPPALPEIPGVELGARYHAGTELVGGDFYDVFALTGGSYELVMGDVCGSGPEAASHTALARHTVRTASMFESEPGAVLRTLNAALVRSGADRFITAVLARVERREPGDPLKITLASGGHPPALICRTDGTVEEVVAVGALLGVTDEVNPQPVRLRLDPGDLLVLYTDGLTEARRAGELFGLERLRYVLARLRDRDPADIASELVDAALRHVTGEASDDIAVLVVRAGA